MRYILFIITILLAFGARAQNIPNPTGNYTQITENKGSYKTDRLMILPRNFVPFPAFDSAGCIWFDSAGTKTVWYHNGVSRVQLGGGGATYPLVINDGTTDRLTIDGGISEIVAPNHKGLLHTEPGYTEVTANDPSGATDNLASMIFLGNSSNPTVIAEIKKDGSYYFPFSMDANDAVFGYSNVGMDFNQPSSSGAINGGSANKNAFSFNLEGTDAVVVGSTDVYRSSLIKLQDYTAKILSGTDTIIKANDDTLTLGNENKTGKQVTILGNIRLDNYRNTTGKVLTTDAGGNLSLVAAGGGSGTVTSITGAGYMLGGTITSSGTLTPDTSAHKLATKTDLNSYASLSGSYANPSWITSLAWSKLTGTPTSLSGYGITDPVVLTSGTYANPSWITSIDWSKITGAPSFITTETDPVVKAINGIVKSNGATISAATSGTDYSAGTSALSTGILKSTTSTGALSIAVPADFPTLNQNTTGTASNVTGTVAIGNGGTGQTTANAALNALLPSQTGNANKWLKTDGTNTSWSAWKPRDGSEASNATPSINSDSYDQWRITALTANITSVTVTGTPVDGQTLVISITGTAARTIAWGTSFEASTIALPTTTVTTNMVSTLFVYNSVTSKWRCAGTW